MIAIGGKGHGEVLKCSPSLVIHQGCFAMHWFWRSYNVSAVDLPNGLVPQADTQDGNACPEAFNDPARQTCFVGCTWPWRYDDGSGLHGLNFIEGHLVVTTYLNLGSQFRQVLIQVVGKTIVVVNQ